MLKNYLSFACILSFVTFIMLSCSKENKDTCTECTATMDGMTTMPTQYCGSESDVAKWESDYIANNRSVGATAKCTRK